MNNIRSVRLTFFLLLMGIQIGLGKAIADSPDYPLVDRGRYLVVIGGCNDCHTSGYLLSEGKVPEQQWLMGDSLGWRGPWGTTYPANLRNLMQTLTEQEWVSLGKSLKARPPMPWFNLNTMKEDDLRAVYQFIRHLGPGGQAAPDYVPPDREPTGPFALFPPPPQ